MAEVIGIVAAAIAFAQATAVALDAMNKIKDAPKNIQELQYELRDLEAVLRQIDGTFPCQKGDPTEPVLRSCSDTLKQLHDLVAPFREVVEDNKIKQYVKGLRIRPKESEIENAVKRLQSQKLTLTLALLAAVSQPIRRLHVSTHNRHEMLYLHGQGPSETGANCWDMKILTRIIDQNVTVVAQQLRRHPTSNVEDLLGLNKAQTDHLWGLDIESVRDLKGTIDEKKREHFLESLCTPDYQQDRLRIKDASATTCEWIWDHHEYLSFRTSAESRILHVLGNAGTGKSVLAKHVWKRLSKELADSPGNDSCALLYYYCDRRTRPSEDAASILRALIHQFLWERPSLFGTAVASNELMQSHSFSEGPTTWTFEALWSIFKVMVINSRLQEIYCVIDAMDECEKESVESFFTLLPDVLNQSATGVTMKLFLTSRIEGHIMDCLDNHTFSITVNSAVTRHDVETYVSERLGKLKKRLQLNAEREEYLREVLVDRAEGMFLWAELAIKDLEKAHGLTAKTLINRVRSLPSRLNALYDRILTNIERACEEDEDTIRLVRKIFTWVALAARPLTLAELRIALAIELDTESLSSVDLLQNISHELLNLCGSFVEIVRIDNKPTQADGRLPALEDQTKNEENENLNATVRLIHQSVREYLTASADCVEGPLSKFGINSQAGNGEIARACLTYLLCKDFEGGPIKENDGDSPESDMDTTITPVVLVRQKLGEYGFLDYAALYWPTHIRECGREDVHLHACKFLCDFPQQFQSWYQISFFLRNSEVRHNYCLTGIQAAGNWGLHNIVRLLLDRGIEVGAKGSNNRTALHSAAQNGHQEVVKLLLDGGAEVGAKYTDNRTALHFAAQNGHQEVVKLLLDGGAEVGAIGTDGQTAVHLAANSNRLEVVKALLEEGANIDFEGREYGYILQATAESG